MSRINFISPPTHARPNPTRRARGLREVSLDRLMLRLAFARDSGWVSAHFGSRQTMPTGERILTKQDVLRFIEELVFSPSEKDRVGVEVEGVVSPNPMSGHGVAIDQVVELLDRSVARFPGAHAFDLVRGQILR